MMNLANKMTSTDEAPSQGGLPVRMYSKLELAQLYFPETIDKGVARRHLMSWIKQCTPLWEEIQRLGYQKGSQFFSPRMVSCIWEYLGTPA